MVKTKALTEHIFRGTPVSGGVAHGVVRLVGERFEEPIVRRIPSKQLKAEWARFTHAVESTRLELQDLMQRLDGDADRSAREILEMHLLVLADSMIQEPVEKAINEQHECAESAYYRVARECMNSFQRMPDAYFRERALDIRDVAQRVLRHLRGEQLDKAGHEKPAICIAHDLTPSETAQLDRTKVLGFAIEHGSKTSHTAIVARSLGLPAVVHLHGICEALHTAEHVLLDGDDGLLILNPTEKTIAHYKARELKAERREARLNLDCRAPAVTLDGRRITVGANAEFVEELKHIQDSGAEGIGLFRTEFLYLENPNASEERLSKVYCKVVQTLSPELVIFRTLDLGGDKLDPANAVEKEANPFLGWRGIRVSLSKRDFFKRQLRAILRASAHGPVGIMYPMVCCAQEVIIANQLLAECREELAQLNVPMADTVQVGAMIEIPSAATIADLITPHVDFFSIGTNDLIQYTLAVDRVNERVADLYQPTHPAVLRLIKNVVAASANKKIWVGMCGEMAGDIVLTPLLIGLGLDELSASSGQVPKVKHAVRKLNTIECSELLQQALQEPDAAKILRMSADVAWRAYPELFEE